MLSGIADIAALESLTRHRSEVEVIVLAWLGTVPMNEFLKQMTALRFTVILKTNLVF